MNSLSSTHRRTQVRGLYIYIYTYTYSICGVVNRDRRLREELRRSFVRPRASTSTTSSTRHRGRDALRYIFFQVKGKLKGLTRDGIRDTLLCVNEIIWVQL